MKRLSLFLIGTVVCAALPCLHAVNPPTDALAARLHDLYLARDYFTLGAQVGTLDLRDPRRLFFDGQLDAAFLRDDSSDDKLRRFLQVPDTDATWRKEAVLTLSETHLRAGDYKAATLEFARALGEFSPQFTTGERTEAESDLKIARALQDVPPQSRSDAGGVSTVGATRGLGGLVYMDVRVNGLTEQLLVDSGANQSVASESFARRHKLQMLPDPMEIQSGSGEMVPAHLGLADAVQIGSVTLRHVVFDVFPDREISPSADASVEGIIGFPVLLALERWRVAPDGGSVEVGTPPAAGRGPASAVPPPNLACAGSIPLARVQYQGSAVAFMLDTGAGFTLISARFGERFPRALLGAVLQESYSLGVGSKPIIFKGTLPRLELSTGGQPLVAHNAALRAEITSSLPALAGLLGADTLTGGYEVDFRRMTLTPTRADPSAP